MASHQNLCSGGKPLKFWEFMSSEDKFFTLLAMATMLFLLYMAIIEKNGGDYCFDNVGYRKISGVFTVKTTKDGDPVYCANNSSIPKPVGLR